MSHDLERFPQEQAHAYDAALAELRRGRKTGHWVRRAGGWEVDARGDEFFAVFRDPAAAIGAALAIQRSLRDRTWSDDVEVRMSAADQRVTT